MNTKGLFTGAIVIRASAEKLGHIGVTIDGHSDELGFGEALGFAAAAWLDSTPEEDRADAAQTLLVGFVAMMQDGAGRVVGGTVENFSVALPEGKPS